MFLLKTRRYFSISLNHLNLLPPPKKTFNLIRSTTHTYTPTHASKTFQIQGDSLHKTPSNCKNKKHTWLINQSNHLVHGLPYEQAALILEYQKSHSPKNAIPYSRL